MHGVLHEWTNEWTDRRTDGQTNGRTDRRKDRRMDGRTNELELSCLLQYSYSDNPNKITKVLSENPQGGFELLTFSSSDVDDTVGRLLHLAWYSMTSFLNQSTTTRFSDSTQMFDAGKQYFLISSYRRIVFGFLRLSGCIASTLTPLTPQLGNFNKNKQWYVIY